MTQIPIKPQRISDTAYVTYMDLHHRLREACAKMKGSHLCGLSVTAEPSACPATSPQQPLLSVTSTTVNPLWAH